MTAMQELLGPAGTIGGLIGGLTGAARVVGPYGYRGLMAIASEIKTFRVAIQQMQLDLAEIKGALLEEGNGLGIDHRKGLHPGPADCGGD
jgi:hypothetical protein